jgi:hypothetical protein
MQNTGIRIGTENENLLPGIRKSEFAPKAELSELLNSRILFSVFCFLFSDSRPFNLCILPTKNNIDQALDS